MIHPRTETGIALGIEQVSGGDGHVFASWPDGVRRKHRVYFIQAGDRDMRGFAPTKIGFTTDLARRLRQLQTASPLPLAIVETVIGTHAIEAFFHRLLRPDDIAEATVRLYQAGLWS